jgi:hypothetical protein
MLENAKDLVNPQARGNGPTALPAGGPAPDFALNNHAELTVFRPN